MPLNVTAATRVNARNRPLFSGGDLTTQSGKRYGSIQVFSKKIVSHCALTRGNLCDAPSDPDPISRMDPPFPPFYLAVTVCATLAYRRNRAVRTRERRGWPCSSTCRDWMSLRILATPRKLPSTSSLKQGDRWTSSIWLSPFSRCAPWRAGVDVAKRPILARWKQGLSRT
jgi:hypothetical protein